MLRLVFTPINTAQVVTYRVVLSKGPLNVILLVYWIHFVLSYAKR